MRNNINTLLLALAAYFAPTKSVLLTTLALVVVDLLTGLVASYKSGIAITSSGMKRTLVKLAVYQVGILCGYLVQTELTGPDLPVMKWISALVGLVELKSVLENLDIISGGSFFKSVINKIQGMTDEAPKQ